jgi:gliding motility-associated-like protein
MSKAKILLVAAFVFLLASGTLRSQSCVAILLNEYSATNVTGPTDYFGLHSDWLEMLNVHTSSVSLQGYWLSNDRFNLKKWKFPTTFKLNPGEYRTVWLSGKNITIGGEYHTNFTLDQCKSQWLILSTDQGVVRDSVFVQKTKTDHTRGRIDCSGMGITAWRLYTAHSKDQQNPTINNYIDYAPTPKFQLTAQPFDPKESPQKGGWYEGAQLGKFVLEGGNYDTTLSCYDIFYTVNGDYPRPFYPGQNSGNYYRYFDTITPLPLDKTTILRFIAVPKPNSNLCPSGYLPSFCETNTYFLDPEHATFRNDFGIISIAMDTPDTGWFTAQGTTPVTLHVEYFDKNKQVSEGYGTGIRPVNEEWRTKQKGFHINIDDRNGFGCNFEGNIFNVDSLGSSPRTVFPTLHLKAGDIESYSKMEFIAATDPESTGIRDVFIQSLAAKYKLNVNPLHVKPVVAFLNGVYWGVYDLREVYDKYYEGFYNGQSRDSVDLRYFHLQDGHVKYPDGSQSKTSANFRADVYDYIINNPMNIETRYNTAMSRLDKASFMDYMILNSYFMNSDLWNYNVAYAKGPLANKPGFKWHYYLWNMPSTLTFTSIVNNYPYISDANTSPCYIHTRYANVSLLGGNGHGNMLALLMGTYPGKQTWGNKNFQLEYKNRYMDLLNSALKCENIVNHYNYVKRLYSTEMYCQEDGCPKKESPFKTTKDVWDTNTVRLQRTLSYRCYAVQEFFKTSGCYGMQGPFEVSVDVQPPGAGFVKLNSLVLESYVWKGYYYQTTLSFKAIPSSTNYAFHHWEFKTHTPTRPASMDSTAVAIAGREEVVAVFTDKSKGIIAEGEGMNIPTGFTPNGDNLNEYFRPLGAAKFVTSYEMTIWNRWGEEVYRSTDPNDVGWDGNFKGEKAVTGVYAFLITYKNIYGENKIEKGNVTLTR